MAGRLTLWGAGELINSFFGKSAEAPPAFYLALILETPPSPYVSGSELDEPEVGSYARVEIPNEISTWTNNGQLQVVSTDIVITFITATADWGRIRYWALCSAPSGGYVYMCGNMEQPFRVNSGDQAQVPAGDLTVNLGPFFTTEEG